MAEKGIALSQENYGAKKPYNFTKIFNKKITFATVNKAGFFSRQNIRGVSKKAKLCIAVILISLIIFSFFAFLPRGNPTAPSEATNTPSSSPTDTPNPTSNTQNPTIITAKPKLPTVTPTPIARPPGFIESTKIFNSTFWQKIAEIAWRYYQPGLGTDVTTGLPWTGSGSPFITDWDVGVYIQAVIDASKLNITEASGDWGFNSRIDKVLKFLETRQLNNASYPFWFYQATDGKIWHEGSDKTTEPVDIVDTGRLFVALNNLRNYNSNFTQRVNKIVLYGQQYNRSNYAALVPSIAADGYSSTSIYAYIICSGFGGFWPDAMKGIQTKILDNIYSPSNGNVSINGVVLPKSAITTDVLLSCVFDINNSDSRINTLTNQVYLAHQAYYNETHKYRAFGEGAAISTDWQWEWVVFHDGRIWLALDQNYQEISVPPFIYTKVAIGFLALNNTAFSKGLCVYLERNNSDPIHGFFDGVDEEGTILNGVGSLTNGLIIGAALYAIQNNSNNPQP